MMTATVSVVVLPLLLLCATPILAQTTDLLNTQLEGVEITTRYNQPVPLQLDFIDDHGRKVKIGDYFNTGKPVIISMNYSSCPLLCSLQLDFFAKVLKEMEWTPGREFNILTVSVDPKDTGKRAAAFKEKFVAISERPEVAAGWHFLSSNNEADIRKLADAIGFGYRFDEKTGEFHHKAALIVCTPDARVSGYFVSFPYEAKPLRDALETAAKGGMWFQNDGSGPANAPLNCILYDPEASEHGAAAVTVLRIGGILVLVALGLTLGFFWFRSGSRHRECDLAKPDGDGDRHHDSTDR